MSILEPHWQSTPDHWDSLEKSLVEKASLAHVPMAGIFELTPFCNLACKMCYVRLTKEQADKRGRQLSTEEWLNLARQALKLGMLNLLLTGGEPLLRSDFAELYTELSHMGFILSINTNATLMTPALRDLFCKYPPTAVNITLYGASRETYQNICGDGEAFDRTLQGMELWAQVPTNMEARTTFIRDNRHEMAALRSIANRFTKRFAINVDVFKAVRGATSPAESCRLSADQAADLIEENHRYYDALQAQEPSTPEEVTEAEARTEQRIVSMNSIPPVALSCFAAKSMFSITWDGKMIPCLSFSEPYTLPLDEGFEAAWNRLPELFTELQLPEKCTQCKYLGGCPNCPANLQAETGSLTGISEYICQHADVLNARRVQYIKAKHNP